MTRSSSSFQHLSGQHRRWPVANMAEGRWIADDQAEFARVIDAEAVRQPRVLDRGRGAVEFGARVAAIWSCVIVLAGPNHAGVASIDLEGGDSLCIGQGFFGLQRIPSLLCCSASRLSGCEPDRCSSISPKTHPAQPSPGHFALQVDYFGVVHCCEEHRGVLSRGAGGQEVFELPGAGECGKLDRHHPALSQTLLRRAPPGLPAGGYIWRWFAGPIRRPERLDADRAARSSTAEARPLRREQRQAASRWEAPTWGWRPPHGGVTKCDVLGPGGDEPLRGRLARQPPRARGGSFPTRPPASIRS